MRGPRALRVAAVARALVLLVGRGAVSRAVPTLFAVLLVYGVFFGPNGLSARELLPGLRALPAARLVAMALWLALLVPTSRALFAPEAALVLRALPIEPAVVAAVHLALLALLQLPCTLFLLRAGAPWLALACTAWSLAALCALALARARASRSLPPLALLAVVLAFAPTPPFLALSGIALAPALALRAFALAPEAPATPPSRPLPRAPSLALAAVHLRIFARAEPLRLLLFAALVFACSALTSLAVVNNRLSSLSPCLAVALGLGAPATVTAAGLGAGAVLRSESALASMLRSIPRAAALAPRASILASLAFTLPAGLCLGLAAGRALPGHSLLLSLVTMAVMSASQGLVCLALVRRAGDASEASAWLLGLGVAQLVTALAVGARGALLWVLAAALALFSSLRPRPEGSV